MGSCDLNLSDCVLSKVISTVLCVVYVRTIALTLCYKMKSFLINNNNNNNTSLTYDKQQNSGVREPNDERMFAFLDLGFDLALIV